MGSVEELGRGETRGTCFLVNGDQFVKFVKFTLSGHVRRKTGSPDGKS